ncbi:polysaccharide pyruvyl transferase family protein [Paenibacillus pasadenensis]|uniref:polysaccharide pyruvyl transferase family protein n=1 Tax=Paenibacillus pasadenensis TaxID=217090 RepID=UPI00203B8047|nr:polysaccharide pyruvyl transferase family protein [Paenibacillus pasadenensis]MCM3749154.1 polysaccharide pyruvyl transferase family protein [Paenibacillus pasadenensis]
MKVLIINAHSSKNKGDAAIIISMIQSIRKFNPNASITISSRYPLDDDLYLDYGCKVVDQITRFPDKKYGKIKRLSLILKDLRHAQIFVKKGIIPKHRNPDIFSEYQSADIIVSCGGGFIYSHSSLIEASLIMHLAQIFFAKKLKKKVITYAQSIGPFHSGISKIISRNILNQVDVITVREELSQAFLAHIGVNNSLMVGDSAFVIETDHIDVNKLIELDYERANVGVTVRQWTFPNQNNPNEKYKRYIQSVVDAIEFLVQKKNVTVYLVPQVTGPTPIEDDRIGSKHVWDLLEDKTKKSVKMLTTDFTPIELKAIYSNFDMFVGTRMHSNIFSLSSHVPTVAISYEPKTTGIMKMLDLSEYVCEINTITSKELIDKCDLAWREMNNYRQNLENRIPMMKSKAEEPAIIIKKLVTNGKTEALVL